MQLPSGCGCPTGFIDCGCVEQSDKDEERAGRQQQEGGAYDGRHHLSAATLLGRNHLLVLRFFVRFRPRVVVANDNERRRIVIPDNGCRFGEGHSLLDVAPTPDDRHPQARFQRVARCWIDVADTAWNDRLQSLGRAPDALSTRDTIRWPVNDMGRMTFHREADDTQQAALLASGIETIRLVRHCGYFFH